MSRTLLWDATPGEVRAAIVEGGEIAELRILRPHRKGALLVAGEIFTARVLRNVGRNKAQVTLGGDQEALLHPARGLTEGQLLAVEMTRAPIPEPGRWKLPVVRPAAGIPPMAVAGWHGSGEAWHIFLRSEAPQLDSIVCADAASANKVRAALGADCPQLRIDSPAIAEADMAGLIDMAVPGEFPLPDGALTIERTRAMTVIDIDGSGDPLALNLAAAREVGRLLRLLDIGGPAGIDFVTMDDKAARAAVDATLADACAALGPHKRTAINGFGFAQIVRPRTGPSVPEMLCGTTPGRLSVESRATALLRDAAASTGHGPRRLVAPPAVIETIRGWSDELGALHASLGAAIELVADPGAIGYGHVHASQS